MGEYKVHDKVLFRYNYLHIREGIIRTISSSKKFCEIRRTCVVAEPDMWIEIDTILEVLEK